MQLIPFTSARGSEISIEYPAAERPALRTLPGRVQCVYILLHPDIVDTIAARFERWFAARPEVSIVDIGTSDKMSAGFICMEWREAEIDELFIAILDDDENIADYTLFGRPLMAAHDWKE
jgi:hypothetical protein